MTVPRHGAFSPSRVSTGSLVAMGFRARSLSAGGLLLSPALIDTSCRAMVAGGAAGGHATMLGARPFFTRFAQQRQLQSLEKDASAYPSDAIKQAEYLKSLNTHDPEAGEGVCHDICCSVSY